MAYSSVIGLEVHAQLNTKTKMFCGCKREFGAEPNTNVCPVCLGMPGTLPVPNEEALQLAVKLGLALNCEIDPSAMWTRKNYFYPDLPKGYQITQTGGLPIYDHPICRNGHLDITLEDGSTKRIRINRIHMEEDAGKLIHDLNPEHSHFDANRCGTPLCEIVTEPDLRTSEEAVAYLNKLKAILQYTQVSDADMEKGNLRCDANVSIREGEDAPLGTRAEVKNLNSFSNVMRAIEAEIDLQAITLDSGEVVEQTTKRFDANTGKTSVIRSKEDSHDYRYFPEPDMIRLQVSPETIAHIQANMPELPDAKKERFLSSYEITTYDASVLTSDKALCDYFEQVAGQIKAPKLAANWIITELLRKLNDSNLSIGQSKISADHLAKLIQLIENNVISGKIAKTVFAHMWDTPNDPEVIVKEQNLVQVTDSGAIEAMVLEVVQANPAQFEELKSGKDKIRGFFVGQVMKTSKGKANPQMVNEILDKLVAA
jgi:aspartyl-tRNA(Asn)/glutamyl-tRNA(Gln) amidotransferase subunit B